MDSFIYNLNGIYEELSNWATPYTILILEAHPRISSKFGFGILVNAHYISSQLSGTIHSADKNSLSWLIWLYNFLLKS